MRWVRAPDGAEGIEGGVQGGSRLPRRIHGDGRQAAVGALRPQRFVVGASRGVSPPRLRPEGRGVGASVSSPRGILGPRGPSPVVAEGERGDRGDWRPRVRGVCSAPSAAAPPALVEGGVGGTDRGKGLRLAAPVVDGRKGIRPKLDND